MHIYNKNVTDTVNFSTTYTVPIYTLIVSSLKCLLTVHLLPTHTAVVPQIHTHSIQRKIASHLKLFPFFKVLKNSYQALKS